MTWLKFSWRGKNPADAQNRFLSVILFVAILGLLSGAAGYLMALNYFWQPELATVGSVLDKNGNVNTETMNSLPVVVRGGVRGTWQGAADSVGTSLLGIYSRKNNSEYIGKSAGEIYYSEELLGVAVVLSRDGWVALGRGVKIDNVKNYVLVDSQGLIYDINQIMKDTDGGVDFLHVEGLAEPALRLGSVEDLSVGDSVVMLVGQKTFAINTISNLSYFSGAKHADYVWSSEKFYRRVLLNNPITEKIGSVPVFSVDGALIGILGGEGNNIVVPADNFEAVLSNVFRGEKITRANFGVNYIDLSHVVLDGDLKQAIKYPQDIVGGALLTASLEVPAVLTGSSAAKAGLMAGDIITEIDNEQIDWKNNLSDVVAQYVPGTVVKVTFVRQGEEQTVEVTLGE